MPADSGARTRVPHGQTRGKEGTEEEERELLSQAAAAYAAAVRNGTWEWIKAIGEQ